MRFVFVFFALMVLAIPPAQATENRIMLSELNTFINETNKALNNLNQYVARSYLNRILAEGAVFNDRVSLYGPAHLMQRAWYGHPAYGMYYRYPANPYYAPTSMHSLTKPEFINRIEHKRHAIPGYQAALTMTDTVINPYGHSAVIDVDLKEFGAAYSPYYSGLVEQVKHSHAKCKMYLTKQNDNLLMTRMDCNTNTSLPF